MKKTLEVGDKIAQIATHSNDAVTIYTVTRVTATLALCKTGSGYELKFGREQNTDSWGFNKKGDSGWSKTYYRLATDADFLHIEHTNIRSRLEKTNWNYLPIEKCVEILKILNQ